MSTNKIKIPTGTKEWASSNINIISGCSHDCKYCYSKLLAVRFKRKTNQTWNEMELNSEKLNKKFKKRKGRIMFPTSHDILPEYKEECIQVLEKLLKAGNSVLITTKPHLEVIKDLCKRLEDYRDLVQFRFTITSNDDDLLQFWEPGAPRFRERLLSLKHAFLKNFKTSVSIEPFLDKNPIPLIEIIQPFVSETIWIGKMNYIRKDNLTIEEIDYYNQIRENISPNNIYEIIEKLKKNNKIRYKDRIKKMNLEIPTFQKPDVVGQSKKKKNSK